MTKEKAGTPKTRGFIIRHQKKLYIAVISVMCLLTCWCMKLSMEYHVLRDAIVASNTLIDIVLMVFITMLFGFSANNKYTMTKQNLVFSWLVITLFAMLFLSTVGYTMYGLSDKADLILVSESLSYLFYYLSFVPLWKYQLFFYKKTRLTKISTLIIYLLVTVYTVLSLANMITPVLFRINQSGSYDTGLVDYASTVTAAILIVTMYINVLLSDCGLKQKIALASYELAPAAVMFISVAYGVNRVGIYLPAVADVAMMFPLYIIFFCIYLEQKDEIARKELEQMKMETSLRISQIQPHFLYNCLSSIAVLCGENPALAEKATTTFADYLRENMNYIGSEMPIPFSDEMRHVEGYVWLEKLRFSDRVNVVYDISCTDFSVPALTVQPLVENAVKHGICKGRGVGTVTIASREDEKAYIVTISDDGVGFDPSKVMNDGKQHIGIESVGKRLQSMVDGSMKVETRPGKGTNVTITVPKNGGTV